MALFVKTWASIPDGDAADPDVHHRLDISDSERYERRMANLKRYPHVVATYFHMKTELYVEHICKGIMGADAYWMRWARFAATSACSNRMSCCALLLSFANSTVTGTSGSPEGVPHVHYFLWLRDAPDLSYLDEWVRETALEM